MLVAIGVNLVLCNIWIENFRKLVSRTEAEKCFFSPNPSVAKIMRVGGRWIKMGKKHWRNDTKEGNQKYWEKKFLTL